uniref:Citrate synthase-lysine N-methyltransferase CSKMT, mitochondrial n=1 Tax=Leptobrachium leishanense TaxID=445787 RepID=A0A8C5R2Q8_9ANUR
MARLLISSLRRHCSGRTLGTNAVTSNPGKGESLRNSMGDRATWDNFYSSHSLGDTSHFDWFFGYNFLRGFLLSMIGDVAPKGDEGPPLHILDVGCGTSDLGFCLFRDSPIPVTVSCIDRCEPAVLAMRERLDKGHPVIPQHPGSRLEYIQGDATDLHMFPSASISLVLDKGTSDALLRSGKTEAYSMVKEAFRVLHPYGKLVQLTDEDPDARLDFLEKAGVGSAVALQELGERDGILYYAYIVTPTPQSS